MTGFLIGAGIVTAMCVLGCSAAVAAVVLGAQAERREERRQERMPPGDGEPLTAHDREVLGRLDEGGDGS